VSLPSQRTAKHGLGVDTPMHEIGAGSGLVIGSGHVPLTDAGAVPPLGTGHQPSTTSRTGRRMYRASSRRARAEIPDGASAPDATKDRELSFRAACGYAMNGWPVLPGSAWNGYRFVVPGTMKVTEGIRPFVPRNYATLNVDTIMSWWNVQGSLWPSVLIRSGDAFRLLSTTVDIGENVLADSYFDEHAGPVILRPDIGRVFFLVRPNPEFPDGIRVAKDTELMAAGAWTAAPPTQTNDHHVRWLITPGDADWRPAPLEVIREVLTTISGQTQPAMSRVRPYARSGQSPQHAREQAG
jgi:hypothetical protein